MFENLTIDKIQTALALSVTQIAGLAYYYGGPAGIRRLMRSWGADVWGADIYDDETIIHARKQQAQYIEIKLRECGIPFRGGLAVR